MPDSLVPCLAELLVGLVHELHEAHTWGEWENHGPQLRDLLPEAALQALQPASGFLRLTPLYPDAWARLQTYR